MNYRYAAPLAAFLAFVACGSSGEPVGVDQSASTFCAPGYIYKCSEVQGRDVCGCVYVPPPTPVCNFVVEDTGSPGRITWIAAWAVASTGPCNDIAGNYGTWKNLVPVQGEQPYCFDGVPNESMAPPGVATCQQAFFPDGNCCTYVWWPENFTVPACNPGYTNPSQPIEQAQPVLYMQDQQALCAGNTSTWFAIENSVCGGTDGDGGTPARCPNPGGGMCSTCSSYSGVH